MKRLFTIEEIFCWGHESGWDEFWGNGQTKSGEELEFYELLTKEMMERKNKNENPDTTPDLTLVEI